MKFLDTAKHSETTSGHNIITYLDFTSYPDNPDYPHLKLTTKTKHIQLETYQVKCKINEDTIADLKVFHAVDGEEIVRSVLESESLIQRQKRLLDIYNILGEESAEEIMNPWKKTIKKIFPKIRYKSYLMNGGIDGSKLLISSIITKSNLIGARSRRGPANFIICNGSVGSLIQTHPSFIYLENNVYNKTSDEIRSIGSIGENMEVFINPFQRFTDNTIIIGRKTQENEPGVYIIENKGAREVTETVMIEDNKMIKSKSLHEKLSFVHTENSERNFIKFEVSFTNKPLWEKILSI